MNKRLIAAFSALVIAAALVGAGNVNAATSGLPGANWWSSFQVQNVGSTDGTLVIQAYTQVGSQAAQYSSGGFTIIRGGGLTYNPGFPPNYGTGGNRIGFCSNPSACTDDLPPGFTGAVVASADVPIVAIGTVNNTKNGSVGTQDGTGRATGSYAAFGGDKVASELFFPVAKHNFAKDTVIYYVQAAGVDASVTITYTMNDGSIHTQSQQIGANRTFLFDPASATPPVQSSSCGGAATSPCLGSARVVASSGVIAGVALEYEHAPNGSAGFIGSSRAFVPSDYSKTVLAPIFKYDFAGDWTGFAVQNTASVTATVNVTFTVARSLSNPGLAGQKYFATNIAIGPYQQTVFSKFRNNLGGMPADVAASAIVVGDQPLVAVMNESQIDANSPIPLLGTYNAFNPANATTAVAAPVVKEYFPGGQSGSSAARAGDSVSIQNAGTARADIQVRYTAVSSGTVGGVWVPAGTTYTLTIGVNKGAGGNTQLLEPGASYVFNMVTLPSRASMYAIGRNGTTFPKDGVNYAVMVVSDQPIIAMIQEDNKPPSGSPADIFNYEGFSQ